MQNIFDTLILPSLIAAIVALVIGAVSTCISGVKIEKFKLKGVVIQSNISKIMELLKCLEKMNISYMENNKSFYDLTINVDMDYIEKNMVTIPCLFDIQNGQVFDDWKIDFYNLSENVNHFSSKEINCFNHVLREYLTTLDNVAIKISLENRWQLGYIIAKDLRYLSFQYQNFLYTYLNKNIYKAKFKDNYDAKLVDKFRNDILENTRLYGQKEEIQKLFDN